jgi:hypothetical protein
MLVLTDYEMRRYMGSGAVMFHNELVQAFKNY